MIRSSSIPQSTTRFLRGISEIASLYDGFILDVWGVLHNGVYPYEGVIDCLQKLNKPVQLLSNAPRQSYTYPGQLEQLGILPSLYDGIVTSGDMVHSYLKNTYTSVHSCYHLGPSTKDDSLFDGVSISISQQMSKADIILNTGFELERPLIENYLEDFTKSIDQDIPMLCANPDLIVHVNGQKVLCAGTLGLKYKELGGQVKYFGKPTQEIYNKVLTRFPNTSKILAIGDAFATDVRGAIGAGLDIGLVVSGIHAHEFQTSHGKLPHQDIFNEVIETQQIWPTYLLPGLIWS